MRRNTRIAHSLVAVCVALTLVASVRAAHARGTITLTLDASDAPKKVLHSKLVIPVDPGPFTLFYPKWIPGEHGPTGPLTDVAGLKITAGGNTIPWQRDLEEMYAIHVTVPEGVKSIDVDFDFLAAAAPEGFNSAASCTENLVIVTWNQVLFYPAGESSDGLTYAASLKLPAGWKFETALPVESGGGGEIRFAPVSLTRLVDSPVLAGEYFRRVELTPGTTPHMYLCMASDSKAALAMPDSEVTHYRHLAAEALSLFGAWHFKEYRLLVPMSDHISHFGLEHHESSEDRVEERMWLDDDIRIRNTNLMPHELTHSWNGKYRRPGGLATPDYQKPMTGELLWVYEGLTQYIGFVLSSRSGIRTLEQGREDLALVAAELDNEPGRTWRPLVDTAVEAQRLYEAADEFAAWRRGVDFYDEGLLIWLDADVTIRKLSSGRHSLDDFCKKFHGGENGVPKVVPYTRADVIKTLNEVAPYDWSGFLAARIDAVTPHAPLGGVEQGGWKLVYTDSLPPFMKSLDEARKTIDLRFSIGMTVNKEDGLIVDVIPGSAAAKAGIGPGMKMVAVNGRHWSKDLLVDAVTATKNAEPLELLVDNNEFYRTCKLDYRGGARYPWLKRDTPKPDLVSEILKAHATKKAAK